MSLGSIIRDILDAMNPPPGFPGTIDRSDPENPVFNEVDWEPKGDAWMGEQIAKAIVDFVEGSTVTVSPNTAAGTTVTPPGPFTGTVAPGSVTVGDGGEAMGSAFGTPIPASGVSPSDDISIATSWANGIGASLSTLMFEFPFSGTTMVPATPSAIPTPVSGDMGGIGVVAPGIPVALGILLDALAADKEMQSNSNTASAIADAVSAILGVCTTALASLPPPAGVVAVGAVSGWS